MLPQRTNSAQGHGSLVDKSWERTLFKTDYPSMCSSDYMQLWTPITSLSECYTEQSCEAFKRHNGFGLVEEKKKGPAKTFQSLLWRATAVSQGKEGNQRADLGGSSANKQLAAPSAAQSLRLALGEKRSSTES